MSFRNLRRRPRVLVAALVAFALLTGFAGGIMAAQPHMRGALRALEEARQQLNEAEHDKAGFRDQALGFVDQAIGAVEKGIAAGAR